MTNLPARPMNLARTSLRFAVFAAAFAALATAPVPATAQDAGSARLKDLVVLEGAAPVQLTGYGLVVGLDRTGDRARGQRGSPYTVQSIANMLRTFGITVDPDMLAARNTAAVMVTTTMNPFNGTGSALDVTVSALGDARSLSGGVLLQTPLLNPLTKQVLTQCTARSWGKRSQYCSTWRVPPTFTRSAISRGTPRS